MLTGGPGAMGHSFTRSEMKSRFLHGEGAQRDAEHNALAPLPSTLGLVSLLFVHSLSKKQRFRDPRHCPQALLPPTVGSRVSGE